MHHTGTVYTNIAGKIAKIVFEHPKSNCLPKKLITELSTTIDKYSLTQNINGVIIASSGDKTFCAGASFDELCSLTDQSEALDFFSEFAKLLISIKKCEIPVLARVQGKAVGGGVGIIATCDYAIGCSRSSVCLSELTLGFGPYVISPALIRKIGLANFSALTLSSDWHSAEWAFKRGLLNEVVEKKEDLDTACNKLTDLWNNNDRAALVSIKKLLWSSAENWEELLLDRASESAKLVLSAYSQGKLKEFKLKRPN